MRGNILIVSSLLVAWGCSGSPLARLEAPEHLTLFSIDGRRNRGNVPTAEYFCGYPVLGKVEIVDPEERSRIISALNDGIAQGKQEKMLNCFSPRHGLRAVKNSQTITYIICFECSSFVEYTDQNNLRYEPIDSSVQSAFDRPLQNAGVPIAPR